MDHIKLIDAARRWMKPECRDQAEIDLDMVTSPTGVGDAIRAIEPYWDELEASEYLVLVCESGVEVRVPL